MYFTRDEDGVYDSLDGKQRSNAISEFLHDEFALSVENGVSEGEISRTLTDFFSGHPSKSPEYNHTVSAGSAKPASVQTRRDVMRSLLPVADEGEGSDPEEFSEVLSSCYTSQDFIDECRGDVEKAERLFYYCDWQHPSSAIDELADDEEEL